MATAVAAFRSLLRPVASTAVANSIPLPPPHFSFKSFQQHRVGLRLFSSHRRHPILLPAPAASGEEFTSDGEYYSEEEEEGEQYVQEEGEEAEPEVQAVRGYYPPRTRPALGQEPGRIYVGNLPYTFTAAELTAAFSEAGSVEDAQIIYDKITNRSRGFAFVTMATAEEATKAVQMFNGALLGGRTVRVNFPEVPRGGERTAAAAAAVARTSLRVVDDGTYKVYAGNLGWGVRADALKTAFEGQPGLVDSRVIFERDTGRSRGFGFLSFQTIEDANAAIQAMDGVELDGRPLRLSLASQNPPAGSTPITVQSRQEETASDVSEADVEASSGSEHTEESNLQSTASY